MTTAIEKVDKSLPARASSIATFEAQLGGREALVEILSQADSTKDIQDLLAWLANPDFAGDSLAAICRMANLTAGDVFLAYERALQTRARVLARVPIAEKLPHVVSKAMDNALTHTGKCPECYGRGKRQQKIKKGEAEIFELVECFPCEGKGIVEIEPDLDQQKLALELGEFCQKSGLSIVNSNTQVEDKRQVVNLSGTLAQLQQRVSAAAFTPDATARVVVDGEVKEA